MGKLIGYYNMKEKHGKVLVLSSEIKNNGVGYNCYTKNVYGEVSNAITPECLGKEFKFTSNVSFGE